MTRGGRETPVTFHQLVLLASIVFALHNTEEVPQMAAWSATLEGRVHPRVHTAQFTVAVVLLTLLATAVAAWAYFEPAAPVAVRTLLVLQAAIAFNAIVPHVALLLRRGCYNPGLVTAVALVAPFSALFFRAALKEGLIGAGGLALAFGLAPLVMVVTARRSSGRAPGYRPRGIRSASAAKG
jgi:hypothetical protein